MLNEFEKILGYEFKNIALLEEALNHTSYVNECKDGRRSNERLEFLGDSVLSIVVSEHIFKEYSDRHEGQLTKLRASLVCERSLAAYAREIRLGEFLKLGRGERHTGGADRDSLLCDAFEAVIAAIYLDGGLEPARKHIMRFIGADLLDGVADAFTDYKTVLQEKAQREHMGALNYVLVDESGPDHCKSFTIQVRLGDKVLGQGTATSKKHAEQNAAQQALEKAGEIK